MTTPSPQRTTRFPHFPVDTPTPSATLVQAEVPHEAAMRARAVLSEEIHRLRNKARLWIADGPVNAGHAARMNADADELELVRAYLAPLDYPETHHE